MKQQRDANGRFLPKVDQPAPVQVKALRNQRGSFAVSFVRPGDLVGGTVKANKRNPSQRRFATVKEARQHGSRFMDIEGHLGYYVTQTNDRPNAWINWETGKTNPELAR